MVESGASPKPTLPLEHPHSESTKPDALEGDRKGECSAVPLARDAATCAVHFEEGRSGRQAATPTWSIGGRWNRPADAKCSSQACLARYPSNASNPPEDGGLLFGLGRPL